MRATHWAKTITAPKKAAQKAGPAALLTISHQGELSVAAARAMRPVMALSP